jgi:hypothetical protein
VRRSVYRTASFSVCSRRRTKFPIIYTDLRLDFKVATHPTASPFVLILEEVTRHLARFAVDNGKSSAGWQEYLTWYEEFPYTFSQRFAELALWLSDLTAVDGCLLLDHKFSLFGFGVEIQVPNFEDEMVYRALDIEAPHCVLEAVENAGTRHRAAYRLCHEHTRNAWHLWSRKTARSNSSQTIRTR